MGRDSDRSGGPGRLLGLPSRLTLMALLALLATAACAVKRLPAAPPPLKFERSITLPVSGELITLLPATGGLPAGWAVFSAAPPQLLPVNAGGELQTPRPLASAPTREVLAAADGYYMTNADGVMKMTAAADAQIPVSPRLRAMALGPGHMPWVVNADGARPLTGAPSQTAPGSQTAQGSHSNAVPQTAQALGGWGEDLWLLGDQQFSRAADGLVLAPPPPGEFRGTGPDSLYLTDKGKLAYYSISRKKVLWRRRLAVPPRQLFGSGAHSWLFSDDGLLHRFMNRNGFESATYDLGQRGTLLKTDWKGMTVVGVLEGRQLAALPEGAPPRLLLQLPVNDRLYGLVASGDRLGLLIRRRAGYFLDLYYL